MSTYRLKNLLAPRSVALVGASPRHGSVGRAILNNIRRAQFKGEFGLVNPRYPEIDGVATVRSIQELAFAPELVVLTAPARIIPGLIDEAVNEPLPFDVLLRLAKRVSLLGRLRKLGDFIVAVTRARSHVCTHFCWPGSPLATVAGLFS